MSGRVGLGCVDSCGCVCVCGCGVGVDILCSCCRFDVAFNLMLTHIEPVCLAEQKFCNAFFHFPRSEQTSQMDDSADVRRRAWGGGVKERCRVRGGGQKREGEGTREKGKIGRGIDWGGVR